MEVESMRIHEGNISQDHDFLQLLALTLGELCDTVDNGKGH